MTKHQQQHDGARREVDNFQPRVQIKKHVEQEVLTLDYAVWEDLVRKYLEHLHYLNLKKAKHADEKR